MLKKALSTDIQSTFHMVSVDGDTSTNDMVAILANGMAENPEIVSDGEDFQIFMKALNTVTVYLCRKIAGDGEGATKLLECRVTGAISDTAAKTAAKSVICSSLVKAAMFGADANWGRILCALGYSGADIDPNHVKVSFPFRRGRGRRMRGGSRRTLFPRKRQRRYLAEKEIEILVDLGSRATGAAYCVGLRP